MGIFDKAKDLVEEHADEIASGVDKAADVIKSKTPDNIDPKIDQAADAIENAVKKLG